MDTKSPIYIAVDFDGTLVKHEFPRIGDLLPDAIRVMTKLSLIPGVKLILLTMRSDTDEGKYLSEAIDYCKRNGIEFWAHNENPDQYSWTTSRKVYSHYLIDDTAVGVPLVTKTDERPWVDWKAIEKFFENIFGKNFGEPLSKALEVRGRTTFTKKPTTGFETQSHSGYVRTNQSSGETHFVAPKSFPNETVVVTKDDNKYKSIYKALKLNRYPPHDIPVTDVTENMFGDHNTHWLVKWKEGDDYFHAGTLNYQSHLENPSFYTIQKYLLDWRNRLQSLTHRIRHPESEMDFVDAMYYLFVSQGYFTDKLRFARVHDITVGDRSWTIGNRIIKMTQEVFDYADKLLYLKDAMAYVFSGKRENEAFWQVEHDEELRLCVRANKFKLLYGVLVKLHEIKMLKGIHDKASAVSYLASATKEVASLFHQSVEEYWNSIPFEPIKQYLLSHQSQGEGEPHLEEIELESKEIVAGTQLFPAHLDVVQSPFDENFSNTFFGKIHYANMPSLS